MTLTINGEVKKAKTFAYPDLKKLPNQVADVSAEVAGREGAGVRLRSLIDAAGRKPGAKFATLSSTDGKFSASVPLDDILDAVLVYQLKGEPLPERLGGPIRFLIPDALPCHAGGADVCANVKYLGKIELTGSKVEDSRDISGETEHG
jgi:DMSO/TMAO reductase YedYZ molybdopterin-dependent catalytic subunit